MTRGEDRSRCTRPACSARATGRASSQSRRGRAPIQVADATHQRLLHFVANSDWSDADVRREAARYALDAMTGREPVVAWIVDDTGFLKQGKHSVGVQRQYTGSAGKKANCQIGVSLTVATPTEHLPVDFELYLPDCWASDRARRAEARIPAEVEFKTKPELALDMVRRAVRDGLPRGVVLGDAGYGSTDFRAAIRDLGLHHALGVMPQTNVFTVPTFNEANLLERLEVRLRGAAAWTTFVAGVDYNARGQRLLIQYGNGTATEYTYDPERFRLVRLKTTRASDQRLLQDLRYTYDPVGNIVEFRDEAQQQTFFSNSVVSAGGLYEYDALYRLTHATGREHPGQIPSEADSPWAAVPHPNDPPALATYDETYTYDEVGNIDSVTHNGASSWTRRYQYEATSNRLASTSSDKYAQTYVHDADGNMTRMPHLDTLYWDHAQRAQRIVKPGTNGTVHFAYDAAGQRVRKVFVNSSGNRDERIYLGGYEVFRKQVSGALNFERQTLHVFDDKSRVALVETKTVENGTQVAGATPLSRFQLPAYLPSVAVELDASGQVISYEEYYPFGATSFHSQVSSPDLSHKRYRHLGNERDEETGLTHHGARLYAAWLGRWTSTDPAGLVDGPNRYAYAKASPVSLQDATGLSTQTATLCLTGTDAPSWSAEACNDSPQPPRKPIVPAASQKATDAQLSSSPATEIDRLMTLLGKQEFTGEIEGYGTIEELARDAESILAQLPKSKVSLDGIEDPALAERLEQKARLAFAIAILLTERANSESNEGWKMEDEKKKSMGPYRLADLMRVKLTLHRAEALNKNDKDIVPELKEGDESLKSQQPYRLLDENGKVAAEAKALTRIASSRIGLTDKGLGQSIGDLAKTIIHESRYSAGERHPDAERFEQGNDYADEMLYWGTGAGRRPRWERPGN